MADSEPQTRWTHVLAVGVAAVLTVVVFDAVAQRAVPVLPSRIEVADGVAAYEDGDPAVLVLGSSHSRGFAVIEQRLAEVVTGRQRFTAAGDQTERDGPCKSSH